jgi:hypothetical protein
MVFREYTSLQLDVYNWNVTLKWNTLLLFLTTISLTDISVAISRRIFSKFGGNIVWVMTRIVSYVVSARNACAWVLNTRACVHSLIFERIHFKFAGNILRLTISVKDYVRLMFTHRAHACERMCARACVIKHSLIYGPILFTFAVNILHITSSMGYLLFTFTHRTHAWLKHSLIYGQLLFKFAVNILHITISSKGYVLFMFTHRAHTCERVRG